MVHVILLSITNVLYFYISNFYSIRPVSNMAVFCNFLVSYLSGMLLRHFLNDSDVPVAPVVTGVTFVFTFYRHYISFVWSLYLKIFSAYYYYYYYY
jgi:hypothetical protein